jgi:hypothetical protein
MNSGLYAFAGASATATAAAWAKRLLEPMTKVSNVYFGLSLAGSAGFCATVSGPCSAPVGGLRRRLGLLVAPAVVAVVARLHGDGHADVAAELSGQRAGDHRAQPGLQQVLGELVGRGEQRGVLDEAERAGL